MMDTIIEMLKQMKPDAEINENTELIKSHIIDSLEMIGFVNDLCDTFDVEIMMKDIVPENFSTPADIYNLIKRIQEEDNI